jgi:hypothetical protein
MLSHPWGLQEMPPFMRIKLKKVSYTPRPGLFTNIMKYLALVMDLKVPFWWTHLELVDGNSKITMLNGNGFGWQVGLALSSMEARGCKT